ncbi:MAG: hypothetical protein MZV64_63135 [Ignavibacteriales bacterium]|nr:hypothetical protein [Ignavibacteriales bacterium]
MKRLNAKGCLGRARHGLRRWASSAWPSTRRSSSIERLRLRRGLVPVDRQPHLLPVLQPDHLPRQRPGHDRRQLPDRGAGLREDQRPDLRHGHGRAPEGNAGQLDRPGTSSPRPSSWP